MDAFLQKGGKTASHGFTVWMGDANTPRPSLTAERLAEVITSTGGGYLPVPPRAVGGTSFAAPHHWQWVTLGSRRANGVLEGGGWLMWGRRDWSKEVDDEVYNDADLARHVAQGGDPADWEPSEPALGDELWQALLSRALPSVRELLCAYHPETGDLLVAGRVSASLVDDLQRLLQLCWRLPEPPKVAEVALDRGTLPKGQPTSMLRSLARVVGHLVEEDSTGAVVGAWRVAAATSRIALTDPDGEAGSVTATGAVAAQIEQVLDKGLDEAQGQLEALLCELETPGFQVKLFDLVTGRLWLVSLKTSGELAGISVPKDYLKATHEEALRYIRERWGVEDGKKADDEDEDTKPETSALRRARLQATATRQAEELAATTALDLETCLQARRLWRRVVAAVSGELSTQQAFRPPGAPEVRMRVLWQGQPDTTLALREANQALLPLGRQRLAEAQVEVVPLGGVWPATAAEPETTFAEAQAFGRGVQAARSGAVCSPPAELEPELTHAWTQGWREEAARQREASESRARARAAARAPAEQQAESRVRIVGALLVTAGSDGSWVDVEDLVEASEGFSREQVTEALARLVTQGRAVRAPTGAYRPVEPGEAPARGAEGPPAAPAPAAEPTPAPQRTRAQRAPSPAEEAPARKPRRSSAEVLEQRARSQSKEAARAAGAAAFQAGVLYDSHPQGVTGSELLAWRAGYVEARASASGRALVVDHPDDVAAIPPHRRVGRARALE